MLKPSSSIEIKSLEQMLEQEKRAQYSTYRAEIEAPLSRICNAGDALGPLILKQQVHFTKWLLAGDAYYSRFRPGDRVEIRVPQINSDRSANLSYDWKVENVTYPAPGKIEVLISGEKPFEINGKKEVFLFKSSSTRFSNLLIKKLSEISYSQKPKILGSGLFKLALQDSDFRELYDQLNAAQRNAVDFLVQNNLNGAIQGPPGTGKTQLLQSVINLALKSDMRVGVTSLTNTAVDNLLGRLVDENFIYDWVRVGNIEKVNRELYRNISNETNFVIPSFKNNLDELNLIGATLHKLAYNKSASTFDLLVIDEAGQVPIYFWPFIERLAKRVVLVGDQFQLPPVFATKHTEIQQDNVFSYLINAETPMLETQYRMRSDIQSWSSEKFYKGKLKPHESVANRDYFEGRFALFPDNYIEARKFQSYRSSSQREADFISDRVEKILKDEIDLKHVGVICPYRNQAGLVNSALQNRVGVHNASKVLVDTVERFQGQEKEVIFLSLGSSGQHQDELRFLSDPKRLNVSVTRAKSRFYCLFESDLWNSSKSSEAEDLNEFLRWVTFGKTNIRRIA